MKDNSLKTTFGYLKRSFSVNKFNSFSKQIKEFTIKNFKLQVKEAPN